MSAHEDAPMTSFLIPKRSLGGGRTAHGCAAHGTSSRWTSSVTHRTPLAGFSWPVRSFLPIAAFELRDQLGEELRGYADWVTTMFDAVPLPRRGVLRKGVIYRVPAPPAHSKREPDPEVLEIIRGVEARRIRGYLEKRKRAS